MYWSQSENFIICKIRNKVISCIYLNQYTYAHYIPDPSTSLWKTHNWWRNKKLSQWTRNPRLYFLIFILMQPIQKQSIRLNIVFFTLLIIGSLAIFSGVSAQTKEQYCQKWFIWHKYKPNMESRCRPMWDMWTQQILNHK